MTQNKFIRNFLHVLIFVNVFLILATFRIRDVGSDTVDWQVMLKLGFWFFTFSLTVWFYQIWLTKIISYDNIFLSLLLLIIGLSCLYAPSIAYSLGAFFSIVAIHVLFYTAVNFIDDKSLIKNIFLSLSFVCLLSLFAYFFMPQFGRLTEWVGNEEVLGRRMSGIVGNPNSMGFCAAFGLICAVYYRQSFMGRWAWLYFSCVAIIFICLILSNSRTSMAAMILALAAGYFAKPTPVRIIFFCFTVCFLILSPLVLNYEELLLGLSRSGNIEEITSGTSRVHIWETAWRLINERPLTGYGYASSNFILPKLEHEIGHAPPHTHNAALQIMFSCGYLGLLFLVCAFVNKIYYCFKFADYFKITLLIFLIVNGITEAILFRGTASLAQVILALVFAADYRNTASELR